MNKLAMSLCPAYDMFASLVSFGADCPGYPAPVTELLSRRLRHRHRHRRTDRHPHGECQNQKRINLPFFGNSSTTRAQAANENWANCHNRLKRTQICATWRSSPDSNVLVLLKKPNENEFLVYQAKRKNAETKLNWVRFQRHSKKLKTELRLK